MIRVTTRWRPNRQVISGGLAAVAGLIGATALIGWTLGRLTLAGSINGLPPVNPLTAILLLASVAALVLRRFRRRAALVLGVCVLAFGIYRLLEYMVGWDIGPDRLFFPSKLAAAPMGPNRMSPATALGFVILGVGLMSAASRGGGAMNRLMALAVAAPALLAMAASAGSQVALFVPMSVYTAIAFLFVAGALATLPDFQFESNGAATLTEEAERGTRHLERNIVIGFAAAVVLLCLVGMLAFQSVSDVVLQTRLDGRSQDVLRTIDEINLAMKDVELGARGYILSGQDEYLSRYLGSLDTITPKIDRLAELVSDDPQQMKSVAQFRESAMAILEIAREAVRIRDSDGLAASVQYAMGTDMRDKGASLEQAQTAMYDRESQRLRERSDLQQAAVRHTIAVLHGSFALAFILAVMAGWIIRKDIDSRNKSDASIRELNASLRTRGEELELANRELESFSYSVSHDLRAPLRGIDGFSQALLEEQAERLDDEGRLLLHRVRSAAQRMGRLIDDLLKLAHVSRYEMRSISVDLSALARAVASDLRRSQPRNNVEVVVADGLRVRGDASLLRVVLDNLLGNAWKFTGKTENAKIELGVEQTEAGPTCFVRDNGAGFDMAFSNKLFGTFQRLHHTEEFPGTGIGLATTHRIIGRHGGRIWAVGKVGEGATFYFVLPMDTSARPPMAVPLSRAA